MRPGFEIVVLVSLIGLGVPQAVAGGESPEPVPLRERVPWRKPATVRVPDGPSLLTAKFRDGLRVRALAGRVRSAAGGDLSAVEALVHRHGLAFDPLIRLPAKTLEALEARAAARTGTAQPDLAGMVVVRGPAEKLDRAARELLVLDQVEWVQFTPLRVEPPCADFAPLTPDYFVQGLQNYHGPDAGLNMTYLWSLGGRGQGIRIADCEYGYIAGTEDLCGIIDEPGQTVHPDVHEFGWDDHGTAVLGAMVGSDNDYGVTGLAPDAEARFFTEWSLEEGGRRVTAVTNAVASAGAGDVVVLEMQSQGPSGGYAPAEYDMGVWSATHVGTGAGVIVVAAAGNGDEDLDGAIYTEYRNRGDSGAIIVGAGSANANHDKLGFSTHGSRVNVQGWGGAVFTLGYGTYAEHGGDGRQRYTAGFAGTSSATPLVAASVAALQSLAQADLGCRLGPHQMRQLLIDTGISQGAGGHIGPFPDLAAAADALLQIDSCVMPACGDGVREENETCDGTDTGACPGTCTFDCQCSAPAPGEATGLIVTQFSAASDKMTIEYDPACEATDNTVVYGPLDSVGTYGYNGQVCNLGNRGTYENLSLGPGSYFFVLVSHDEDDREGSYGLDGDGLERPEDLADPLCVRVQALGDRCD